MSQAFLFSLAADLAPGQQTEHDIRRAAEAAAREGERRKREGMALAAAPREHLLAIAREMAHDIAMGIERHADGRLVADGLCSADDVAAAWEREQDRKAAESSEYVRVPWLGNGAGQLFCDGNWQFTGTLVKSVRPHANANLLRVWKWKHVSN